MRHARERHRDAADRTVKDIRRKTRKRYSSEDKIRIVRGTFLEGFAILVLALPLVQPIMEGYNFDMIWFGVLMVIVLEMGLISPPVGINVFVVKSIAQNVSMNTIFRGIWPFWFAMLLAIIILVLLPDIALFLPDSMFGGS